MSKTAGPRLTEKQATHKTVAHVLPLFIFLLLNMLPGILEAVGFAVDNDVMYPWYRHSPEQWVYPLQTIVGLGILVYFWRQYDFGPVRGLGFAVLMAIIGIVVWIVPGWLFWKNGMEEGWYKIFGFAPRLEGFDPTFIKDDLGQPAWFAAAVFMRFVRMVVLVALVEEIFWRGFLMRFLLDKDGDYWEQPFGKFSWVSLVVVTLLFMFAHAPVDYFACIVYGLLTYWVAVRTKSLMACVVMHAVANLALGLYTMATQQWGYW